MRILKVLSVAGILCFLLFISRCKSEPKTTVETINVCVNEAPDGLFPFTSKSSIAGQITSKIYLPLADFNPETLVLEPVLLEEIPEPKIDTTGEIYDMKIEEDAKWSDGKPVTANDVLFTLKLIGNPYASFGSIRSTLNNITALSTADAASKAFKVTFNGTYHLDLEAFTNLPILPAHIFDPQNEMDKYEYSQLIHLGDSLMAQVDSVVLKKIVDKALNSNKEFVNIIGSGGYKVSEWMPGQRLTLSRVEDYWGIKLSKKRTELQAFPAKINYLIIPEEATAMAALKSGQIDIMADVKAENVDAIKNDPNLASKYTIASPDVLQYFYIGLNNSSPLLRDIKLRTALNHLVNVDQIITTIMDGNASRVLSPILSQKPYFVNNLKAPDYNPNKAAAILDQSGYKSKGADGVRTKMIDGKNVRLSMTLLTTGKQLGKDIAALLSEEARKIGVEIKIETMDFSKILERIKAGKYDMANLVVKQFPGLDDPYIAWNSANAFGKGSNYCNFSDPAIDRITEAIRTVKSNKEREKLYKDFQRKIVVLSPVIFLFSPKNQIVVKKELDPVFSSKRPGYFENTMK